MLNHRSRYVFFRLPWSLQPQSSSSPYLAFLEHHKSCTRKEQKGVEFKVQLAHFWVGYSVHGAEVVQSLHD